METVLKHWSTWYFIIGHWLINRYPDCTRAKYSDLSPILLHLKTVTARLFVDTKDIKQNSVVHGGTNDVFTIQRELLKFFPQMTVLHLTAMMTSLEFLWDEKSSRTQNLKQCTVELGSFLVQADKYLSYAEATKPAVVRYYPGQGCDYQDWQARPSVRQESS